MTAPLRSALAEHGEFPDVETLVADVLAAVVVDGQPIGAEQVDTDISGLDLPAIQVYRPAGAGGLDWIGNTDTALVYVATWANDRGTSKQMDGQVRKLMLAVGRTHGHRGILVDMVEESASPGQLPAQPDNEFRCVESQWTLSFRRHRGTTVYP